jgi:uncharacterized protein (DUF362 family)
MIRLLCVDSTRTIDVSSYFDNISPSPPGRGGPSAPVTRMTLDLTGKELVGTLDVMAESRVVLVKARGVLSADGDMNSAKLTALYERGLSRLFPGGNAKDALRELFHSTDTIGIKINTIGGRSLSTRPEVAAALSRILADAGTPEDHIIIWDRSNRELKEAGFSLRMNRKGLKVYGTDAQGVGYSSQLTAHRSVGSLFSRLQSRVISASVSLAVLKDHGLAGVTGGLKNYFGAIHNPNKYHDNHCDPYVAEVFDCAPVKRKHRLTVLDALKVQYHRGPAYHSRWADLSGALIFSTDPVAADIIGWRLIEKLRAASGLPSLVEEDRAPRYLQSAADLGLGEARYEAIDLQSEEEL